MARLLTNPPTAHTHTTGSPRMTTLDSIGPFLVAHGFGRARMSTPDPGTGPYGFTLTEVRRQTDAVRIEWRLTNRRRLDDVAFKGCIAEAARARDLLRGAGWTVDIPHPGTPTLLVTTPPGEEVRES